MALFGSKNCIIFGLIVIALALTLEAQITATAGAAFYYIIVLIGLGLGAYGVYIKMSGVEDDAELNEEQLRDKVILHTLARMTNADSNVMQVEVESVQETYKSITGNEVTSKDIRVASLGELFEEKPFCTYLSNAQKRISTDNKKKIMKALSTIMKSDGVVNPLEVDFFNVVAKCLNMKAGDLVDL